MILRYPDVAIVQAGETVTIRVTDNDVDVDGDALTVRGVVDVDGTATINPDNTITYTPDPGINNDSFFYFITDGHDAFATGVVDILVID